MWILCGTPGVVGNCCVWRKTASHQTLVTGGFNDVSRITMQVRGKRMKEGEKAEITVGAGVRKI